MPYALFCKDAQLSKAFPSEADVWKQARHSGLVVDTTSEEEKAAPRPVLDNDYEIKPCQAGPGEDPARNKAEAEREAQLEPQFDSWGLPSKAKTSGVNASRAKASGTNASRAKASPLPAMPARRQA
jgi:hypothetical protein